MKTCSKCLNSKPLKAFRRRANNIAKRETWCRLCKSAYTKQWRQSNPHKVRKSERKWRRINRALVRGYKRNYRLKYPEKARQQVRKAHARYGKTYRRTRYFALIEERHGLTKSQLQAEQQKQKNLCAICLKKQKCGKRRRLYVDHNHKTQKFRGLLCFSCNAMLGFAKDSMQILGIIRLTSKGNHDRLVTVR